MIWNFSFSSWDLLRKLQHFFFWCRKLFYLKIRRIRLLFSQPQDITLSIYMRSPSQLDSEQPLFSELWISQLEKTDLLNSDARIITFWLSLILQLEELIFHFCRMLSISISLQRSSCSSIELVELRELDKKVPRTIWWHLTNRHISMIWVSM